MTAFFAGSERVQIRLEGPNSVRAPSQVRKEVQMCTGCKAALAIDLSQLSK